MNIHTDAAEFDLRDVGRITLKSYTVGEQIAEAKDLLLLGSGYPSEILASDAASRTTAYFQTAFARLRIAADFGLRAPAGGGLGAVLRAQLEQETGRPLMDDVHGAVVFPCEPRPRFFRASAGSITLTQSEHALSAELERMAGRERLPSKAEDVAYDLFSASFSVAPNADAASFCS